MDHHPARSDLVLKFAPYPNHPTKRGIDLVQRQNYHKEMIYQYMHRPFSKHWYDLRSQRGLPLINKAQTTREEWSRRLDYRNKLRKRALRSQFPDDLILMILEWSGDTRGTLTLPPLVRPGERCVRFEDSVEHIWPDATLDRDTLAAFRRRIEPIECDGDYEQECREECGKQCLGNCSKRKLLAVKELKLDVAFGSDAFDFELYYGKAVILEQRREYEVGEVKRAAADQPGGDIRRLKDDIAPSPSTRQVERTRVPETECLPPNPKKDQLHKRSSQDASGPHCDLLPTISQKGFQQPQQNAGIARQVYCLPRPRCTSANASDSTPSPVRLSITCADDRPRTTNQSCLLPSRRPSVSKSEVAQPQLLDSPEVPDDRPRPHICAPILQRLPSTPAPDSTNKHKEVTETLVEVSRSCT